MHGLTRSASRYTRVSSPARREDWDPRWAEGNMSREVRRQGGPCKSTAFMLPLLNFPTSSGIERQWSWWRVDWKGWWETHGGGQRGQGERQEVRGSAERPVLNYWVERAPRSAQNSQYDLNCAAEVEIWTKSPQSVFGCLCHHLLKLHSKHDKGQDDPLRATTCAITDCIGRPVSMAAATRAPALLPPALDTSTIWECWRNASATPTWWKTSILSCFWKVTSLIDSKKATSCKGEIDCSPSKFLGQGCSSHIVKWTPLLCVCNSLPEREYQEKLS